VADYWLGSWIDEQGIRKLDDLRKVMRSTRALERALELADESVDQPFKQAPATQAYAVASRSLDLSTVLNCAHEECVIQRLDKGLAHVWQYFDTVVVEGLGPRRFQGLIENQGPVVAFAEVLTQVSVYMHAREIGALPFLQFREKPHLLCAKHFRQHAKEIGLPVALDGAFARSVVKRLATEGSLSRTEDGAAVNYFFTHPLLDVGLGILVPAEVDSKHPVDAVAMAEMVYADVCTAAVGDVALARMMSLPLVGDAQRVVIEPSRRRPPQSVDSVALSLELPMFVGATAKQVLHLRESHRPEYAKFRAALTKAIQERIALKDEADERRIATRLHSEFVAPALADIEAKLKTSLGAMSAKAASGIVIGGALTTVGVLTGMPLLIGSGAATAASVTLSLNKFFDDRREVRLSDMYFLWLASKRLHGH
jgi:hypothetical protein